MADHVVEAVLVFVIMGALWRGIARRNKGTVMMIFSPRSVRELKKQAGNVTDECAEVFMGRCPAADLQKAIETQGIGADFRQTFRSSVAAVGAQDAMQAAMDECRLRAGVWAESAGWDYTSLEKMVEQAVIGILAQRQ